MTALRALVLEDDPFACCTSAAALRGHGFDVVGECTNANDAVSVAAASGPDVLVTDLDLGRGPTGIAVAHVLRRHNPALGVVLLTNHVDPRSAGTSLAQVPEGTEYVTKQSVRDIDVLAIAIARAVRAAPSQDAPRPATSQPVPAALSDAQMETLRLVAAGLSNAEIARRRDVSERGIERMIARLIVMLGIDDQPEYNRRMALGRAFDAIARGEVVNGLGTAD